MDPISRRAGLLLTVGFGIAGLFGCSGAGGDHGESKAVGQMSLPLTTQGASGTSYRLRNATFVIQSQYYNYGTAGSGSAGYGSAGSGTAGAPGYPQPIIVSSETDPDAQNISVSLEEGSYIVNLQPGWYLEKNSSTGPVPVEATLLTGATQWIYIYRQSTSWAEYSFGIGGREIWLNGKLNIGIDVQETPFGYGGAGGAIGFPTAGRGGSTSGGASGAGGSAP